MYSMSHLKQYDSARIFLSCLYAIQSCTARRITRLVATLAKFLGDREGALVAL